MKIINFNFTKIEANRLKKEISNLKIETSINISNMQELKIKTKEKESFAEIIWQYGINYSPKIASFKFEGTIVVSEEAKKLKEILKGWQLKKIDESFKLAILNLIFKKASIKALELEEEFNLPSHIKLPSLKIGKDKKN